MVGLIGVRGRMGRLGIRGRVGRRGPRALPSACTGASVTAPTRGRPTAARSARAGTPPPRDAAGTCAEVGPIHSSSQTFTKVADLF